MFLLFLFGWDGDCAGDRGGAGGGTQVRELHRGAADPNYLHRGHFGLPLLRPERPRPLWERRHVHAQPLPGDINDMCIH